jgi:hypothetical protein
VVRLPVPRPEVARARGADALSAPLTSFIGCARVVGLLAGTLADGGLVTLVGPGGSG